MKYFQEKRQIGLRLFVSKCKMDIVDDTVTFELTRAVYKRR